MIYWNLGPRWLSLRGLAVYLHFTVGFGTALVFSLQRLRLRACLFHALSRHREFLRFGFKVERAFWCVHVGFGVHWWLSAF